LARVLHDYIRLRNSSTMTALASRGPPELIEAARMQDRIGWFELMNGKIAIQLVQFQEQYCMTNNDGLNGKSWSSSMVRQLLDMSHSQWLYRNFSLHHQTLGYLHRLEEKSTRNSKGARFVKTRRRTKKQPILVRNRHRIGRTIIYISQLLGVGDEGSPKRKSNKTNEGPTAKEKRYNIREELDSHNDVASSSRNREEGPFQHGCRSHPPKP